MSSFTSGFYLLGVNRMPSDTNAMLHKFALVLVFKAAAAAKASLQIAFYKKPP